MHVSHSTLFQPIFSLELFFILRRGGRIQDTSETGGGKRGDVVRRGEKGGKGGEREEMWREKRG